ncbi:MAG: hypothetical protein U0T77_01290 [Chitinophagales bacterium]
MEKVGNRYINKSAGWVYRAAMNNANAHLVDDHHILNVSLLLHSGNSQMDG